MSSLTRITRSLVLAGLGVLVLAGYVAMVLRAPELLLPPDATPPSPPQGSSALTPAEALTAAHNARLLAISFGGALVVLAGLLYTARNYRLAHRGQVTDRFTKALERLGSDELYVRIGGIHALEHVLRDSADHHGDIVEVLVAFIRERVPRARGDTDSPLHPRQPLPSEPEPDVQAALTALAHRPRRRERDRIDLAGLHLRGARLARGRLARANLAGGSLQDADLTGARLRRANLVRTQLQGARLGRAHLQRADLAGARLDGARLEGARLRRVRLVEARLDGAHLDRANLKRANLARAQLRGAYLSDTRLQRANMADAQLGGVSLNDTYLQRADLRGTQLQGAHLERARLRRANLARAQLRFALVSRAQLRRADLTGAQIQGANLDWVAIEPELFRGWSRDAVIALDWLRVRGAELHGEAPSDAETASARSSLVDEGRDDVEGPVRGYVHRLRKWRDRRPLR